MSVKVKLSYLINNFDGLSDEYYSYLNRLTGQVVMVSSEAFGRVEDEEIEDDE